MKEAKVISILDKNDNKIYHLSDDGNFHNKTEKGRSFSIAYAISSPKYEILSVQDRNGLVYRIGDKFKADMNDTIEKIVGFKPVFTGWYVHGKTITDDINFCRKYK